MNVVNEFLSDPERFMNGSLQNTVDANCQNCRRVPHEFPMAFRQEPYCSDKCRKALGLDLPQLDARH
jgi:hypothetical protein